MKTFEIYHVTEEHTRKLVASIQADYYEKELGGFNFYRKTFGSRKVVGFIEISYGQLLIADTEFLLAPPETKTPLAEYFPNFPSLDPCHAPQPDPEPTPRRRKSKGSTLGLD